MFLRASGRYRKFTWLPTTTPIATRVRLRFENAENLRERGRERELHTRPVLSPFCQRIAEDDVVR